MAADDDTFGAGVEKNGQVVYAMIWDKIGIRIWHFKKDQVPDDLVNGAPDPSTWPIPDAFWSTDTCHMDDYFKDHVIVINTRLCGYVENILMRFQRSFHLQGRMAYPLAPISIKDRCAHYTKWETVLTSATTDQSQY